MRNSLRVHIRGFTLLELLVVLSVLSVVTTIGMVMLARLMDYHRYVSAGEAVTAELESLLEQFRADASSVIAGPEHVKLDAGTGGLTIVAADPTAEGSRNPAVPVRITYRVVQENGGSVLIREEMADGASAGRVTLRAAVASSSFAAASGAGWREVWHEAEVPDALRLVVTAAPDIRVPPASRAVTRFVDVNQ
mgnify:FL=1